MAKKMVCVANDGYDGSLTIGKVYEVEEDDGRSGMYRFVRDTPHRGNVMGRCFKARFKDVKEDDAIPPTAPSPTMMTQSSTPVDEKKEALNFFKRRGVSDNECPCGSTRGVCPDHR